MRDGPSGRRVSTGPYNGRMEATVEELGHNKVRLTGQVPGADVHPPDETLVIDLVSPSGETRSDYVVELGRGTVVEELEQALTGMSAGETKEVAFELAEGGSQEVTATVKEIKERVLPPLDDELARTA